MPYTWYALDLSLSSNQQEKTADALFSEVRAMPATLQLACTPLLSTILILVWRNEGALPKRRVDLYERCCRVLIEHWEAHHDVAYQGALAEMDWEAHLDLLAPLAYAIHSQEQKSVTRKELVPLLASALQAKGDSNGEQAAKEYLQTLVGLRSSLLQYIGDDRYRFSHLTFQEYLAARHIAAQPDPDYLDLVMIHLHEAWWQQVHLLTIAHLGSSPIGATKASSLILTILYIYPPPTWILRFSHYPWLRLIGPRRYLPWVQLERRIAWIQGREFELATRGYMECMLDGTGAKIGTVLSVQAASLVRCLVSDEARSKEQKVLLDVVCQLSQRQGGEEVVSALLLVALHDRDWGMRMRAAESLGKLGVNNEEVVRVLLAALHDTDRYVRRRVVEILSRVRAGNEEVVSALLAALHDRDGDVRLRAAGSLGHLDIKNPTQLRRVLVALNRYLYDESTPYRRTTLVSIRQLLDGRPIPGYRWVPLQKRRAQKVRLKRIAFWLGTAAFVVLIGLATTWLLGALDPNGFLVRLLAVLAGIIASAAAVAQVLGQTWRDPWERS